MRFRDDTRGVTVQVGAVLLFATIIIALSVYQATVVPAENSDVEYRHSQQVQGQLVDVRNALVSTATTGDGRPATVSLGTEYPNRVFLVNPPPAAGTLGTNTTANPDIEVSNVAATNEETRDYLDGSWTQPTKALTYVPGYNEYRNAPRLRYEASLLSNYYPDRNTSVPLTEQLVVDEQTRTVSLVALNGSLSTSRSSSVAVDPAALSAPASRVQVQPRLAGQPVNVTLPTVVDAGVLRNSTSLGDNPNVTVTQSGTQQVTLAIDWSGPFTLRTAKVGVGSGATNPDPHYLTLVEADDDSVTVEARDEYNNPESGEVVRTNRSDVFEDADGDKTTGEDGRVTFEVDGDQTETDVEFELVDGGGNVAQRTVTETVGSPATSPVGNGTGGSLVYLGDGTAFDGEDDDDVTGGVSFSVENRYASDVTITDVTVLPEDGVVNGLSDKGAGYGYGRSELTVSSGGQAETADVPLVDDQYVFVGARGLTLSLAENRSEDIYDTGAGVFGTAEVNASAPVTLAPDDTAQVSFAEFYTDATTGTPSAANVTNEDFRMVVSYERDGRANSEEYVVYADEPTDGVAVTSIVPNAAGQTQTIEFTMDSAMDASESIEVDLSDAQSVGPDQVDYQSGSASVVSGPSPSNIGFAQRSSTDAVVTYSPSSDLSAGQTVTLEVTGVSAGPTASQSSPYVVTWSRTDGGSKTATFSVARDAGDANLQSVSVSDLGSGPGQTQTLSFTPDDALEGGERVAIDLSEAQAGAVDYSNAGVNSVSTGSASKNQNGDTVYVTYTAPSGGVTSGTTVDVELSGVEATGSGTYDAGFSRARGDTASATFSAGGGGNQADNVEIVQTQINNGQIDIQLRNNNPSSVTFTQARLDSYTEADAPGGDDPIDRTVYRPDVGGPTLVSGDPLEGIGGPTLSNGANGQVTLQPQRDTNPGTPTDIQDADAEAGDTFELTIEFNDGSTRTYSVTL